MVLENDRVVAWDLSWPAGAESPDHIHDYDYVIVPLDGGAVRYTGVDGASRIEIYTPGQAVYVKAGESHREVAARGAPRAIVVALK
jgi:quercetin dioxygenase-like cupin family protein